MIEQPIDHPEYLNHGEQYMSLNRLLNVNDLPRMTVHIKEWDEDGKEAKIIVRALSNVEKRNVMSKAKDSPNLEALWITRYAIVEPSGITDEHVKALDAKNPAAIEQIARISTWLGQYSVAAIERYIRDYAEIVKDAAESASEA